MPPRNQPSSHRPPVQAGPSNRPDFHLTRPSIEEQRPPAARGVDHSLLTVPSSNNKGKDSEKDGDKLQTMRHEANVRSTILRDLDHYGIPWYDARYPKSEKTTLSARYRHKLSGYFNPL